MPGNFEKMHKSMLHRLWLGEGIFGGDTQITPVTLGISKNRIVWRRFRGGVYWASINSI
jgi:hypothetical protein